MTWIGFKNLVRRKFQIHILGWCPKCKSHLSVLHKGNRKTHYCGMCGMEVR